MRTKKDEDAIARVILTHSEHDAALAAAERADLRLEADQLHNQVVESENAISAIRATGVPTLQQLSVHANLVGRYQTARNKADRA